MLNVLNITQMKDQPVIKILFLYKLFANCILQCSFSEWSATYSAMHAVKFLTRL